MRVAAGDLGPQPDPAELLGHPGPHVPARSRSRLQPQRFGHHVPRPASAGRGSRPGPGRRCETSRLCRRICRRDRWVTSAPARRTVPDGRLAAGASMHRPTVDLPEPLSPTSAITSPGAAAATPRRPPGRGRSAWRGPPARGPRRSPGRLRRRVAHRMLSCASVAAGSSTPVRRADRVPAGHRGGRQAAGCRPAPAASGGARTGTACRRPGTARRTCRRRAGCVRTGTRPGISCSRSRPACRPERARPPAARPCSGAAAGRTARRPGPLDDPAGVHDHDPVGDVGDHAEVVGDERGCGAEPVAQVAQHVEDPGLHGDVECGGGLVGDQHLRWQATAMAIMTRWRMPPDSWCG